MLSSEELRQNPAAAAGQNARAAICLIVPALNEAKNLEWLLPLVVRRYRVVVVDNGSTDATAQVARALGAELVVCERKGYGRAVLAGMAHVAQSARAGIIAAPRVMCVFDADGTSPFEAIPQIVDPILAGTHDFVIGQRTDRQLGAMPPHALFGNWLAVSLISWATGQRFREMGPLRALAYEQLLRLRMEDKTWGWNVEMQVKAAILGLRVDEVDIRYNRRRHGRSKISGSLIGSVRAGYRILTSVFKYARRARQLV